MSLYTKARELARGGTKPLDIAADLGIRVFFLPFKSIKGIALSLGSEKFILIDSGLTEIERQLVCGHEVGHILLHPGTNFLFVLENTYFYSKHEYQANRFACELMVGEKAEHYGQMISEAASSGRLDRLIEVVGQLVVGDDVEP
ncbi:MAG: ImmA/IrrE family metallo-endopeptidase [Firmicutes bacterium]|nr:ImmA/IrrE family metallo-endopeptidase [Bacillota bacterium]